MRLVIVGGIAAGMSAAMSARRQDPSLEIVVLERGPVASYGACGLPYWIEGQVRDWRELIARSPEQFAKERIDLRTGVEVAAISHPRREMRLGSGETLRYDKLVIATGARAREIPGSGAPHVFHLVTLGDAIRLKERLSASQPGRAIVVGGGYIGLEAAEALRANGWTVEIVVRGANLLHRGDEALTAAIVKHLERCRVAVKLNHAVEDASALQAGLVLAATGLRPNVELAAADGIELGRTGAIAVTGHMETNLHGVYAAGDCAEHHHIVTGRPAWIPLGTTANKMGRIAGANAAGARGRFPGVAGTAIVRICGLAAGVTGLSAARARAEGFQPVSARIEARDRPRYFHGRMTTVELVADRESGRLLGASILGEEGAAGRINTVAAALAARMTAEDFQHLDLAYAPPYASTWDPLLIAARQLVKSLR